MSFSRRGYYDSQEAFHRFDNRLATIEETNAAIQGTLHNHAQWQVSMGHEMANVTQSCTMAGKHGTQDGQPRATTAIAKSKLGGSVPAPSHPATSLSNHDNNQLGEDGIPRVSR